MSKKIFAIYEARQFHSRYSHLPSSTFFLSTGSFMCSMAKQAIFVCSSHLIWAVLFSDGDRLTDWPKNVQTMHPYIYTYIYNHSSVYLSSLLTARKVIKLPVLCIRHELSEHPHRSFLSIFDACHFRLFDVQTYYSSIFVDMGTEENW